jgi:hypothetical protein
VWLRKHYHFGPAKIAMYLARHHDLTISISGVWRILKRLGMNRLPASQHYRRHNLRWKRYKKQRPRHQLQVDVKFIEPLGPTGSHRIDSEEFYRLSSKAKSSTTPTCSPAAYKSGRTTTTTTGATAP